MQVWCVGNVRAFFEPKTNISKYFNWRNSLPVKRKHFFIFPQKFRLFRLFLCIYTSYTIFISCLSCAFELVYGLWFKKAFKPRVSGTACHSGPCGPFLVVGTTLETHSKASCLSRCIPLIWNLKIGPFKNRFLLERNQHFEVPAVSFRECTTWGHQTSAIKLLALQ